MADVFISYASEDRERTSRLASALEANGWSVWWDRKIIAGQAFDQAIERELETAKSVVVLWSKDSSSSEWVKNEAAAAAERGVLVPALIDLVKIPLEFRRKQTVDLVGWEGDPLHEGFKALCAGISGNMTGLAPPRPTTVPLSVARWNRHWIFPALSVVALALLLGIYRAGFLPKRQAPPESQVSVSVAGVWRHESGVIWVIKPVERSVFSVEQMDPNQGLTLTGTGTLKGDELRFEYILTPDKTRGEGRFRISSDGQQLSGEYKHEGENRSVALVFRR